jgi:hypothetical protein
MKTNFFGHIASQSITEKAIVIMLPMLWECYLFLNGGGLPCVLSTGGW